MNFKKTVLIPKKNYEKKIFFIGLILGIILILIITNSLNNNSINKKLLLDNFTFKIIYLENNSDSFKNNMIETKFVNQTLIYAKKTSIAKKTSVEKCEEIYDSKSNSWKNTLWISEQKIANPCFNNLIVPKTIKEVNLILNNNSFSEIKNSECHTEFCYELEIMN